MKKFLFISMLFVLTIASSAQGIYTKKTKYDKFDDVVWTKTVKTLITMTDTTIVFETKGQKPETYEYLPTPFAYNVGSRDSLANLVEDIWGYESHYIIATFNEGLNIVDELKEEIDKIKIKESLSIDDESDEYILKYYSHYIAEFLVSKFQDFPTITFRTISRSKYSFSYDTDLVWIKFPDGSRIIYEK